jgi:predicted transcriptional regulator
LSWTVKKTSIYIDPEIDRALGRRARAEGRTKAALIRDALADAAAPAMRVKPRGSGVFAGPGDLSQNVDDYLAKTGFGEN